jgi:hypothetical protein
MTRNWQFVFLLPKRKRSDLLRREVVIILKEQENTSAFHSDEILECCAVHTRC